MSKRIDHAKEAQEELAAIQLHFDEGENGTARATMALTHATLALVEQQRLANVIEVAKWNSDALVRGARKTGDAPLDFEAEVALVDALFAGVQKGLGLS